ncbi:MAG: DUF1501 domain-containing protein [Chlorobi bacterium]|nr:DUF1501 domain-containing protein [Chlorobiota bacterium]
MNRRYFLQKAALSTGGIMLLPSALKAAFEARIPLNKATEIKKLVVIQLSGGNDGLNMVVPYSNDLYYKVRPRLAVSRDNVLPLSDYQGLNPVMTGFSDLFKKNMLTVINSVGYPDPDRSHFRSMDIWQSASDSNQYLNTGWIGRYLNSLSGENKKPHMAIEVGDELDLALVGDNITGIALENPGRLYENLQRGIFRQVARIHSNVKGNSNLDYIYRTMNETIESADYIHDTLSAQGAAFNSGLQPGKLSGKLSIISSMINAGFTTKVYYTSLTGFDTHTNQRPQQDRLLKELSDSVSEFISDLEKTGMTDNVVVMIFSEFGRRVAQNASNGTDHGCANNVLLIGKNLKSPGFYNEPPNLKDLDKGDLKYKIDFRSVYGSLLENHLDSDAGTILGRKFPLLNIV